MWKFGFGTGLEINGESVTGSFTSFDQIGFNSGKELYGVVLSANFFAICALTALLGVLLVGLIAPHRMVSKKFKWSSIGIDIIAAVLLLLSCLLFLGHPWAMRNATDGDNDFPCTEGDDSEDSPCFRFSGEGDDGTYKWGASRGFWLMMLSFLFQLIALILLVVITPEKQHAHSASSVNAVQPGRSEVVMTPVQPIH